MWQFLFFIIFILLLQGLSKILEKETRKRRSEEKPITEEELEKYFGTLGLPPIRIPKKEKLPEKKTEAPRAITEEKLKPIVEEKLILEPKIPEIKEELSPFLFSLEKIEEGIILSEILGLPKALRIRRGGEIGRHARLKIS